MALFDTGALGFSKSCALKGMIFLTEDGEVSMIVSGVSMYPGKVNEVRGGA